jgi:hypothetical protein
MEVLMVSKLLKMVTLAAIFFLFTLLGGYASNEKTGRVVIHGHSGDEYTDGWYNGRYWKTLDLQRKIDLLTGINTGMFLMANELFKQNIGKREKQFVDSALDSLIVPGFKVSEFAKAIDKFYANDADVRIALAYAYLWVLRDFRGENPEILQAHKLQLRRDWNR